MLKGAEDYKSELHYIITLAMFNVPSSSIFMFFSLLDFLNIARIIPLTLTNPVPCPISPSEAKSKS